MKTNKREYVKEVVIRVPAQIRNGRKLSKLNSQGDACNIVKNCIDMSKGEWCE